MPNNINKKDQATPQPVGVNSSFKQKLKVFENNKTVQLIKKIFGYIFRYGFPLAISLFLILWLFHKVNFHHVMAIIHSGGNYWYIGGMMLATTLSLMVRGVRWGLQLKAAGVKPMTVVCEWVTLFGAYALNLVFPQM